MTAFLVILLIVFLGVALLVFLSGIALYARLMNLRNAVTAARSEIDKALKIRKNLGPRRSLREVEDTIAAPVRDYNAAVRAYNSGIEAFPARLFAKRYNLHKAEFFDMKHS